jgi:hypothetical protein
LLALMVAGTTVAAVGCGYSDENTQAARVVAQSFLTAYAKHDPAAICKVVEPSLAVTFAAEAGGSCEKHIISTFMPGSAAVTLGIVKRSGNRARAYVAGDRSKFVGLIKLGSLWRVTESWQLPK